MVLILTMAMSRNKIQVVTPTTGQTIALLNSDANNILIVTPATTLATLTIALPTTPHDGQNCLVFFSKPITALSLSGGTLSGMVSPLFAFDGLSVTYDATNTQWLRNKSFVMPYWYKNALKDGAFPRSTSATSTSGVFTFNLTDDDTSTGTALYGEVYQESLSWFINDATNQYSLGGYTLSANKKVLSISVNRLTFTGVTVLGISVLGSNSNTAVPNGTVMGIQIWGS